MFKNVFFVAKPLMVISRAYKLVRLNAFRMEITGKLERAGIPLRAFNPVLYPDSQTCPVLFRFAEKTGIWRACKPITFVNCSRNSPPCPTSHVADPTSHIHIPFPRTKDQKTTPPKQPQNMLGAGKISFFFWFSLLQLVVGVLCVGRVKNG